jgi:hypothetical protein
VPVRRFGAADRPLNVLPADSRANVIVLGQISGIIKIYEAITKNGQVNQKGRDG